MNECITFEISYGILPLRVRGYKEHIVGSYDPFQATGMVEDSDGIEMPFFFRYRDGVASVEVRYPSSTYVERIPYQSADGVTLTMDEYATVLANILPAPCVR